VEKHIKKYALAGVFLCLTMAFPTLAQQVAAAADPPSKAEVERFMELMQVRVRMAQMFDAMKGQARLGAEQGFKKKVPNPTPEQLKKVDAMADEMFSGFPVDEVIDAMVPIYQKHLSKSDLDAVTAFYSSPVGQKFIKEAPAMMSEAMQAGGEIARSRMTDLNDRLQKRIADLAEEGQQSAPAKELSQPK
jgi:uncharacterized protein